MINGSIGKIWQLNARVKCKIQSFTSDLPQNHFRKFTAYLYRCYVDRTRL